MKRRILTVIVADTVEQPQWILVPRSMEFCEILAQLVKPELRGGSKEPQLPENFKLFDWNGQALPGDIRVSEVPLPGIIIAVLLTGKASRAFSRSTDVDLWLFRQTLMRDETGADRLSRFLSSPDATVVPDPLKGIDIFVSYSFQDSLLAAGIVRQLESRGLQVFLAESSLSTGRQWREQIRDAVKSSRRAIMLITPSSVHSSWVLAEAGALASQNTPLIVLFDGIQPREMPGPLRNAFALVPVNQPGRWLDAADYRVQSGAPERE